tara:strand:+ start:481 stop:627 length:147 start_codon:yes stop_codon:yes gene_type:complete
MLKNGFSIETVRKNNAPDSIQRSSLKGRFSEMSDADFKTSGAYVLARK